MAPKNRKRSSTKSSSAKSGKKRPRGLLGLTSGYNSESDDDYQPTEPAKKHKNSPAKARASKQLQCSGVETCLLLLVTDDF
jgi:hypothetical protein